MKVFNLFLTRLLFILANFVYFIPASAQVPEIPVQNLQDISMATWGPLPQIGIMYSGPIILYNPIVESQVGPYLTVFFRAHEYCHISLNHIQQMYFLLNPYNRSWMSQSLELEADACATQSLLSQGNIMSVQAAAQWFYGQGPIQLVPSHPPGQARAINIVNVARSMGRNL